MSKEEEKGGGGSADAPGRSRSLRKRRLSTAAHSGFNENSSRHLATVVPAKPSTISVSIPPISNASTGKCILPTARIPATKLRTLPALQNEQLSPNVESTTVLQK